jgi:hypothetical protein
VIILPEYHQYCDGCVHHTLNATYISANLASTAMNFAAMSGNERAMKGVVAYNVRSNAICSEYATNSKATYLLLLQSLQSTNISYAVSN